ncbi:hypothetical protein CEXT_552951 [Caerostris extrusa]|uniref:Uncharacterized protein n=1 Tax=Caerostris extrusa TaxID=172846 RepID=A0AAV4XYE7_CAEEX|nr:hypothetical protein CEXT_552951 [Caerostris extrusa]
MHKKLRELTSTRAVIHFLANSYRYLMVERYKNTYRCTDILHSTLLMKNSASSHKSATECKPRPLDSDLRLLKSKLTDWLASDLTTQVIVKRM